MQNLFAKKEPKEVVRESRRGLEKNARELDRELAKLKLEEKKLLQQVKAAAKQGNNGATRVLAKSLVRLRQQMTKLTAGKAQLNGISTQLMTVGASHTVGTAMKSATKAMETVAKATDVQKMPETLAQFMKENEKMELAQEMTEDAVDMAFDTEGMEDEADDVMNQVLDEIGIDLAAELAKANAPKTRKTSEQRRTAENEGAAELDALTQRLGALRE